MSPAISVELPPSRRNADVFRGPGPLRLLVPWFFYRFFYRVPNVGAWKEKES
jgi:hypothetical protein